MAELHRTIFHNIVRTIAEVKTKKRSTKSLLYRKQTVQR